MVNITIEIFIVFDQVESTELKYERIWLCEVWFHGNSISKFSLMLLVHYEFCHRSILGLNVIFEGLNGFGEENFFR